jgi:hypothetical protein
MREKSRALSEGTTGVGREPGANGGGREHPIGRQQVAELQRSRILTAMAQEVSERGAANVSSRNLGGQRRVPN